MPCIFSVWFKKLPIYTWVNFCAKYKIIVFHLSVRKITTQKEAFFLWKNWIAMKFDLFSNLRPAGDTVAAASWVKFTPLNGETDCSTCVTQNLKEKLQNVFQVFLQHSLDKHVNCQQSIYLFKGGKTFWRNYFWARMVTISSSVNSLMTTYMSYRATSKG